MTTLLEPARTDLPAILIPEKDEWGVKDMVLKAGNIVPTNTDTEKSAMIFIDQCKQAEARIEEERVELLKPINEQHAAIHNPRKMAIAAFEALRGFVQQRLNNYRATERARLAEEQRKANAKAEEEKAEADRKAAVLREEADKIRDLAPEVGEKKAQLEARLADLQTQSLEAGTRGEIRTIAKLEPQIREVTRLIGELSKANETQAVRLENKAEQLELKAATTAPTVVQQQAKTVDLGDGRKYTERSVKDWRFRNGLPRDTKFTRKDPRFRDIPDECFVFAPAIMTKLVKAGSEPGGVVIFDDAQGVSRKG